MKKNTIKILVDILIFIAIIGVALFVRSYKIESLPVGIHVDEAGMAYDAFCLANFGVDRYLNYLPVYLINFGGGQSALYAYLAVFFIEIFGIKTFALRIPAVLVNMIAIVAVFLMSKKHIGKKSAFLITALLAINPWNIMASRWGLDCNLLAPLSMISLWLLFRAEKWYDYIFAGISIGITLYTYAISYIILPVFLLLILIYMLYTKRISFKNIIFLGIPIFILALPLILMILVNNGIIDEINWIITIPKLPEYRGTEINFKGILDNIKSIKKLFTFDDLSYNAINKFGTLYYFAIPITVIGIIIEVYKCFKNIKNKEFKINTGIFIFFISVLISLLLIENLNINKGNAIFFPLIFFQFSTIKFLYEKMNKKIFYVCFCIITIMYAINFIKFVDYYFNQYGLEYQYQVYFENDLTNAIAIVNNREELKDRKVNILTTAEKPYIYTLLVNQPSPYDFDKMKNKDNEWGKYVFNRQEIDNNMVYIIKDYGDFAHKLYLEEFIAEQIGQYILFYK